MAHVESELTDVTDINLSFFCVHLALEIKLETSTLNNVDANFVLIWSIKKIQYRFLRPLNYLSLSRRSRSAIKHLQYRMIQTKACLLLFHKLSWVSNTNHARWEIALC